MNKSCPQFTYNPDGQLVKVSGPKTIVYIDRIYEKNLDTGEETKYYFGPGGRLAMRAGSTLRYLAQDHLGSTAFVMNETGDLESHVRYYPYGMTWSQSATPATDRLFTGHQQMGAKSGTYYANARFYSADIARFPQPDSLIGGGYAYADNNPTNYTDPTGHDTVPGVLPGCGLGSSDCGGGGGGGGGAGHVGGVTIPPTPTPKPTPKGACKSVTLDLTAEMDIKGLDRYDPFDIFPDHLAQFDVSAWFERYSDCRRGSGLTITKAVPTPNVLDLTWIPLSTSKGGNAGFRYAHAQFWSKVGHVITLTWDFTYFQETAFNWHVGFRADKHADLLAVNYNVWWEYRVCDVLFCYWGSDSESRCFPTVLFELCEPW